MAADFDRLLAIYGGDRTRWPAAELMRFEIALAAHDATGVALRQALREARGLDRLLNYAPVVPETRARQLRERIVQAALTRDVGNPSSERVVPFAAIDRSSRIDWTGRRPARAAWGAVALLAASLLIGIFAGSAGQLSAGIQELAEAVGLGSLFDPLIIAASDIDLLSANDEDVL